MTDFLTYELLTPETADPVIMRITGQRERGFEGRMYNGVYIGSSAFPVYRHMNLYVHGNDSLHDRRLVEIPLADWPAVKQAIRELNEAKEYEEYVRSLKKIAQINKEKDMNLKKIDEYNKMVRDIAALVEPVGYDLLVNPDATLTVSRKKQRVGGRENTPVKVEWVRKDTLYFPDYETFYTVQFRVTGWNGKYKIERVKIEDMVYKNVRLKDSNYPSSYVEEHGLSVNQDARDKWSAPVLLPESIYKELDNICKALEEKANEVKG